MTSYADFAVDTQSEIEATLVQLATLSRYTFGCIGHFHLGPT